MSVTIDGVELLPKVEGKPHFTRWNGSWMRVEWAGADLQYTIFGDYLINHPPNKYRAYGPVEYSSEVGAGSFAGSVVSGIMMAGNPSPSIGSITEIGGKKFRVTEVVAAPYPPVEHCPPGCIPSVMGGGIYVEPIDQSKDS